MNNIHHYYHFIDMSKHFHGIETLHPEVKETLIQLGERLHARRIQRNLSLKDMAERMLCSINTYRALEAGKPSCSMGHFATALWLLGQLEELKNSVSVPVDLAKGRRASRKGKRTEIGADELDF